MDAVQFRVVIPARHASTRLPGKPLLQLAGKPMLQHVYERAVQSGAAEVIVATDDRRILTAAQDFGASAMMTSDTHTSGTERLAEVVAGRGWQDDTVVVNLQGDEPLMPPGLIAQVASDLAMHRRAVMATLAHRCSRDADIDNPNVVKVVTDREGYALYFSRAPIPFAREGRDPERFQALRHIGLYAYRAGFLSEYQGLEPSPLEQLEQLEQLRVLWHGLDIHVGIADEMPGPGVDTREDLERVAALLGSAVT